MDEMYEPNITPQEFYAFMATWEFYLRDAMKDFSELAKKAEVKGDIEDAYAKASIVVALDEVRKTALLAFKETFTVEILKTKNKEEFN